MSNFVSMNGDRLYHIQSNTGWSDSPYDLFIWSDQRPDEDDINTAIRDDLRGVDMDDQIKDIVDNAECYTVWAENIRDLRKEG